jgi:hypothetical protein
MFETIGYILYLILQAIGLFWFAPHMLDMFEDCYRNGLSLSCLICVILFLPVVIVYGILILIIIIIFYVFGLINNFFTNYLTKLNNIRIWKMKK